MIVDIFLKDWALCINKNHQNFSFKSKRRFDSCSILVRLNKPIFILMIKTVFPTSPVKTACLQRVSDQRMKGIPIFRMKKIKPTTKNSQSSVLLNTQPLPGMHRSEPFLKSLLDSKVHSFNSRR